MYLILLPSSSLTTIGVSGGAGSPGGIFDSVLLRIHWPFCDKKPAGSPALAWASVKRPTHKAKALDRLLTSSRSNGREDRGYSGGFQHKVEAAGVQSADIGHPQEEVGAEAFV